MRVVVPVLFVLSCAACAPSSAEVRDASGRIEPGWRNLARDGVSVSIPPGWKVQQDRASGRLDIRGGGNEEAAFIWPVFLPAQSGTGHVASLVRTLAERAWPDADWEEATVEAAGTRIVLRIDEDETVTAIFGWNTTPRGTAGVIYGVRADEDAYPAFAALAGKVFATFRMVGAKSAPATGPAPAPALPPRARFVDPREQAFSVEVPRGWPVEGGVFRFGAVDVRLGVETRSPDGAITVRLGEPSIGTFVTNAIGYGEGSVFSPGYGQTMTVRRYTAPAAFAAQYASQRQDCRGFQATSTQARPDLTAQMNGLYQRYGLSIRLDAGEVSFTCGGPDGLRGYWLAVLQIVQMGGPAMWKPEYLLGYVAPPSREAEARQVLSDLIGTIQIDAGWYQRQTGQAGQVSRVVSETGEAIARAANGGYWERTRNERASSVAQSNATLGIEQVENPETGARYDVAAGSNRHWVNPQGTIVGTQTDAVPHVDFSPLTRVPPGR